MMKCVVDGYFLTQKITGTQRYSYEILAELDKLIAKNSIEILVPEYAEKLPNYQNIRIVKYGNHKGLLWQQTDLAVYLRHRDAYGVFLNNIISLSYPKGIIVLHDVCYRVNPQFYQSLRDKMSMYWHRLNYRAVANSDMKIVTVSEFSKREIIKYYSVNSKKIHVINSTWQHIQKIQNSESTFARFPELEPKKYYFSMSSLQANKNFKWVLYAAKNNPNETFAIAGGGKLKGAAGAMGLVNLPNVCFLGYVSDEDAKTLMSNCKAFLFPTLYEGFGLPPMEALACGSPAIVSDIPVMHEIYGDSVRYIDPNDYHVNLSKVMQASVGDSDKVLRRYSWKRSATIILKILETI